MTKTMRFATILMLCWGGVLTSLSAHAQIQSELTAFSDSFISSDFEATQRNNYQFIGGALKTTENSPDSLYVDLSGAIAIGEPLLNYFNISQVYFENKTSESQTLTIGRKKLDWSQLDARWRLGVWEPLFKWNPLKPESQGLSGFFWKTDRPHFSLTLFASPLYLPDQGPSYDIQNGEFIKSNPWFHSPPEAIHLFNETTRIEYRMKKPNESQIVLQASYGAKLSFGDVKDWFFQLSQIYKPANQLAIGYDGVLDIPTDRGVVDLQPEVFYHSLSGADTSYRYGSVLLGASILYDSPKKDNSFESRWTRPVFQDALLASGFVEINGRFSDFYYQRLDITGGQVTEEGPLANSQRRPLTIRYPFRQANELGLKTHFGFAKVRRFESSLSYTRSDKNDFSMMKVGLLLKLSHLWSVHSEAQLISAGSVSFDNQNEIAQYANNDRFTVGATYVF